MGMNEAVQPCNGHGGGGFRLRAQLHFYLPFCLFWVQYEASAS